LHVAFFLFFGFSPCIWILCADVSEHRLFHPHKSFKQEETYEDGTECSETWAHKIQTP
jgi:hypothetical protein